MKVPATIQTACWLLFISVAASLVIYFNATHETFSDLVPTWVRISYLAAMALFGGFLAILIYRGRKWPIYIFILNALGFAQIFAQHFSALAALTSLAYFAALILLFLPNSKMYFASMGASKNA